MHWRQDEDFFLVECEDGSVFVWQLGTGHLDRVAGGVLAEDILAGWVCESGDAWYSLCARSHCQCSDSSIVYHLNRSMESGMLYQGMQRVTQPPPPVQPVGKGGAAKRQGVREPLMTCMSIPHVMRAATLRHAVHADFLLARFAI